ncbi:hypothetical protein [Brassicibacter mesophilus]|uniref:hypothetical protein n=1 Tax=Brassicibacter mesophilus TaxID=745119 RepID=UPI003D23DA79
MKYYVVIYRNIPEALITDDKSVAQGAKGLWSEIKECSNYFEAENIKREHIKEVKSSNFNNISYKKWLKAKRNEGIEITEEDLNLPYNRLD